MRSDPSKLLLKGPQADLVRDVRDETPTTSYERRIHQSPEAADGAHVMCLASHRFAANAGAHPRLVQAALRGSRRL